MARYSKAARGALSLSRQIKWRHSSVLQSNVDQAQLSIEDAPVGATPFSFCVIGDTDFGDHHDPAAIAFNEAFSQQVMSHLEPSRFLLHTGDVTYPTGSFQNYFHGFLEPYRALLDQPLFSPAYRASNVVFNRPVLPVMGNHDYATQPTFARFRQRLQRLGCDALRAALGIDLGHYGGEGGEAFGQTFLDDLSKLSDQDLTAHLLAHYSAKAPSATTAQTRYCLNYRPGQFTRLPNRYYTFHYGGIDFFALDSNTWNMPPESKDFDHEQLAWLETSLINSWQNPNTIGRIVYLHHSPYTTEASRCHQLDTLWVRKHLRQVFDQVSLNRQLSAHLGNHNESRSGNRNGNRYRQAQRNNSPAVVDLVISGHAHCLEHLKTTRTGHADAATDWLVCGGSGTGLRRQRSSEKMILENFFERGRSDTRLVAQSQVYAGAHGTRRASHNFHSFVRIDIQPHQQQIIRICPFIITLIQGQWHSRALNPIPIETSLPLRYASYAA